MKKVVFLLLTAAMTLPSMAARQPMTLFLVGDETVAEQTAPEDDNDGAAAVGWGQELAAFLPEGTIIENHALDGATSKSFIDDGQWNTLLGRAKRRNVVLIEFGHHEYDEDDPRHYSGLETFENTLMQMVQEAKKKGLRVILATPTSKCFYRDSVLHERHGAYPEGVRRVAQRLEVPLIDLETLTRAWLDGKTEEESRKYFAKDDDIRLNREGAKAVAEMVVKAAKEQKVKGF